MRKKVLVADDTADIRDVLKSLIECRGHEVIVAENGLVAYEQAWKHLPDLILMDIGMPIMDGIEAIAKLRADLKTSALRIVCITSYDRKGELNALAAGCDEAFSKSTFISDFDRILKKYLEV